jgi:hypothetical protein
MRLPELLTILNAGESVTDPVTGNVRPGEAVPTPWWGLVQQRFVATGQRQIEDAHIVSEFIVLLEPGAPIASASSILDEDGRHHEIVAFPRPRRPVRGPRAAAYIAAYTNIAADSQETP